MIVADRLADERLWAEVLSLGAYDLVPKPFETKEILRVLSTAWRRGRRSAAYPSSKVRGCAEDLPVEESHRKSAALAPA